MVLREHYGIDAVVEHKTETALGCKETEFLVETALRNLCGYLLSRKSGVAAFPG